MNWTENKKIIEMTEPRPQIFFDRLHFALLRTLPMTVTQKQILAGACSRVNVMETSVFIH